MKCITALFLGSAAIVISTCSIQASTIHIPSDYPTIQQGIDISMPGDTVLVHPGTYIENLNYNGKNVTVASLYISTLDTSYLSTTIIDGSGYDLGMYGSCVSFHMGETQQAQLIGFTITNGTGNPWFVGGIPAVYGGGIFIQNASPTLHHLKIQHNRGEINGTIIKPGAGGGLSIENSNAIIHDIEFLDNSAITPDWDAPNAGGAAYIVNCPTLTITNVSMFNDTCGSFGGAVAILNSNVDLIDCLIVGNHSYSIGGAIEANTNCSVRLINCTVVDNHSDYFAGGGIYIADNTELQIVNSIFWMNTPYEMALDNQFAPTSTSISYSDLQGGIDSVYIVGDGSLNWFESNIDDGPLFTDILLNDFTLASNSPCINRGIPDTTGLHLPPTDLNGVSRVIDTIDIGAYEYFSSTGVKESASTPGGFSLEQAYPNPFNSATIIKVNCPDNSEVSIFDITGRKVTTLLASKGTALWKPGGLPSGVYFARIINAGSHGNVIKMVYLK